MWSRDPVCTRSIQVVVFFNIFLKIFFRSMSELHGKYDCIYIPICNFWQIIQMDLCTLPQKSQKYYICFIRFLVVFFEVSHTKVANDSISG